jgi:hypothetical protein
MFVSIQNCSQFLVLSGMFFAWHPIFAMLPAAAPFIDINMRIFPSASYISCSKYNSPAHFYSPPLLCRLVVTEPCRTIYYQLLKKLKIHQSSGMNNLPLLLLSSGKYDSQDLVPGNEHTASRQKI